MELECAPAIPNLRNPEPKGRKTRVVDGLNHLHYFTTITCDHIPLERLGPYLSKTSLPQS